MRSLPLVLALLFSLPAAAATPPVDARAAFRKRNTQHFTALEVDRAGRIRHVRTDDKELAGDDDFTLRGWLQQNADLLGGRAEDNDPRRAAGALAYYLLDDENQITGAAIAHRERGVLDVSIVRATRSPDAEAKALVGTRHVQVLRYGVVPQRDCAMGGDPSACKPRVTSTQQRSVVLTADQVSAQVQLRVIRGAVRLVVCVSAEAPAPETADEAHTLISMSLSGLPLAVDAESGTHFAIASCNPEL